MTWPEVAEKAIDGVVLVVVLGMILLPWYWNARRDR